MGLLRPLGVQVGLRCKKDTYLQQLATLARSNAFNCMKGMVEAKSANALNCFAHESVGDIKGCVCMLVEKFSHSVNDRGYPCYPLPAR